MTTRHDDDLLDRRRLLTGLGAGAVLATGAALAGCAESARANAPGPRPKTEAEALAQATGQAGESCELPSRPPRSWLFPNDLVRAHDGRKLRFYDDLVRGIAVEPTTATLIDTHVDVTGCAVANHLAAVQQQAAVAERST